MPPRNSKSTDLHPGPFGEDVRRVRLARGLTQKHLGLGTGYSEGHVSRIEAGLVNPSAKFAEGCDRTFGTGDLFVGLLRRATEGEHPSWFAPFVDAERSATAIRDFSTIFIYGLLQTRDYAYASLRGGHVLGPDSDIESRVTSRLLRRDILSRSQPPRLWVVLHEACLRARVGSARVMADQLDHLLHETRARPALKVQVLPDSASEAAIGTPYTILDQSSGSPMVYVEGPQGGRPYEAQSIVSNTVALFDHLRACALSPDDSVAYISAVKDMHERNARAVEQVQLQRPTRRQLRRVGPGARVRRGRPGAGQ